MFRPSQWSNIKMHIKNQNTNKKLLFSCSNVYVMLTPMEHCNIFKDVEQPKLANLWHACPKWHAAVFAVSFFFFYPASAPILWRVCVYIRISDRAETVYELLLLLNNTASETFCTNRECRPGGDWENTWHWTKRFTIFFSNRQYQQPQLLPYFLLVAFLEEAFIRSITIILCINYAV